jgi:F0F1-type ATP synthase membrane subunit c/vacuolar-type H+-ATPase subunit K
MVNMLIAMAFAEAIAIYSLIFVNIYYKNREKKWK